MTIYYAFKQSERKGDTGIASTGWETFLAAVINSGFVISGTWPMRTELSNRMIGIGTNALASSVVLVCRQRADDAPVGTRREFMADLRSRLPPAIRLLQTGNIAPVDLAQAAIGPGMGVYTRYAKSNSHLPLNQQVQSPYREQSYLQMPILTLISGSIPNREFSDIRQPAPAIRPDCNSPFNRNLMGRQGVRTEITNRRPLASDLLVTVEVMTVEP